MESGKQWLPLMRKGIKRGMISRYAFFKILGWEKEERVVGCDGTPACSLKKKKAETTCTRKAAENEGEPGEKTATRRDFCH